MSERHHPHPFKIPILKADFDNRSLDPSSQEIIDVSNKQEIRHNPTDASVPNRPTRLPLKLAMKKLHSNFKEQKTYALMSSGLLDDRRPCPYDTKNSMASTSDNIPSLPGSNSSELQKLLLKGNDIYCDLGRRNLPDTEKFSSKTKVQPNLISQPVEKIQVIQAAQIQQQETSQESLVNVTNPKFIFSGLARDLKIQRRPETHINKATSDNQRSLQKNIPSNLPATQNLYNLAHNSRSLFDQSNDRLYLATLSDYMQKNRHVSELDNISNDAQISNQQTSIDRDMMRGLHINPKQSVPPLILMDQLYSQLVNQNLLIQNKSYYEQLEEQQRKWIEANRKNEVHHNQNTSHALNISNEYKYPAKKQKMQNQHQPQNYQRAVRVGLQEVSKKTQPSRPEKVSRCVKDSHLSVFNKQSHDPKVTSEISEKIANTNVLPQSTSSLENYSTKTLSISKNIGIKTESIQFTPIRENLIYIHPLTKILVVNRSTNTVITTEHGNVISGTNESFAVANSAKFIDSACQVNEYSLEEPASPNQEKTSEHKQIVSEQNRETFTESTPADDTIEANHNKRDNNLTTTHNSTEKKEKFRSGTVAEQQMLKDFFALFSQLGTVMSATHKHFYNIHSGLGNFIEATNRLEVEIDSYNKAKTAPSSKQESPVKNPVNNKSTSAATHKVSQVTEKKLTGQTAKLNSNNDSINEEVSKQTDNYKHTFVLPPEYDPNNTRWTLKYRKSMPGLVKLLPHVNIYVNKERLAKIKKSSHDCRELARQLMMEIFSEKALGVCSLHGGKAKAFSNLNLRTRPGLDDDGKLVLLSFVEKYGREKGWEMLPKVIDSCLRAKIVDIRNKYESTK